MRLAPLYRRLVPQVVMPLGARLGQRMWSEARRLERLQWSAPRELEARNVERVRALVAHAAEHVSFYRERFGHSGVRARELAAPADLARLPVVTKADLRARFPDGTTADNVPARRRQPMATSGSTGMPFSFYWDRAATDLVRGTYLLMLGWAGAAVWDARIVVASPAYFYLNQMAPSPRWRRLAARMILGEESVSLSADTLTTARFRDVVRDLSRRKQYFVRGYPAPIAGLAARLLDEGHPRPASPKVVITLAETLTPANESTIEEAFGCRVVNYYSTWEVPQLAQSCPDNASLLHVNADRVILRVVRSDGSDAAPGETGQVVVTDLENWAMPFINYGTGDRAAAGPACPCGRGLPTLSRLEGRGSEMLYAPGGREISGSIIGQFLAFVVGVIPYVLEYQAVQTADDSMRLLVIPTARFTPEVAEKIRAELEGFLGPGMRVTLEPVASIPVEASGKRLLVKRVDGDAPGGAPPS